MCAYGVGCALRGGARPLGQAGEVARQSGLLCGPCENGERGEGKGAAGRAGLGFQLSFGSLPNRNC
jgi:hypothetical protein